MDEQQKTKIRYRIGYKFEDMQKFRLLKERYDSAEEAESQMRVLICGKPFERSLFKTEEDKNGKVLKSWKMENQS